LKEEREIFLYINKSILKVKKANSKFFYPNEIELFIIKNNNYNILDHVPKFYGECDTNLGLGLMYEIIKDSDGSISKTLGEYIKNEGISEELIIAVEKLKKYCYKNEILINDLSLSCICVKRGPKGIKLYICDGFGDKLESVLLYFCSKCLKKQIIKYKNRKLEYLIRNGETSAKEWRNLSWIRKIFQ
jgi:hypothetical protein